MYLKILTLSLAIIDCLIIISAYPTNCINGLCRDSGLFWAILVISFIPTTICYFIVSLLIFSHKEFSISKIVLAVSLILAFFIPSSVAKTLFNIDQVEIGVYPSFLQTLSANYLVVFLVLVPYHLLILFLWERCYKLNNINFTSSSTLLLSNRK